MYVQVLPLRGMPPRGSIQDRIACEMLLRTRRRAVTENVYLARILSAGLNLNEKLFQLWTTILTMEVFQESYQPEVVQEKEYALKLIQENVTQRGEGQVRVFKKLHKLTVLEDDLKPATPAEYEAFQRRLRKMRLNAAQGK